MDIIVFFVGLMLHVGTAPSLKTHLAIVDEPGQHTPVLVVISSDGSTVAYPLRKLDKISFTHGTGGAGTSPVFRADVPELQNNTRTSTNQPGTLDPKVAGGDPTHSHVLGFFFYPPGSHLTVSHHSSCQARFILDDPSAAFEDVAITNVLRAPRPATGTVHLDIFNNNTRRKHIPIGAGDIVIISNRTTKRGQHFAHYKGLTNAQRIAHVDAPGTHCTATPASGPLTIAGPLRPFYDPFPECGNSQWP
jgi:hypothetical protein